MYGGDAKTGSEVDIAADASTVGQRGRGLTERHDEQLHDSGRLLVLRDRPRPHSQVPAEGAGGRLARGGVPAVRVHCHFSPVLWEHQYGQMDNFSPPTE